MKVILNIENALPIFNGEYSTVIKVKDKENGSLIIKRHKKYTPSALSLRNKFHKEYEIGRYLYQINGKDCYSNTEESTTETETISSTLSKTTTTTTTFDNITEKHENNIHSVSDIEGFRSPKEMENHHLIENNDSVNNTTTNTTTNNTTTSTTATNDNNIEDDAGGIHCGKNGRDNERINIYDKILLQVNRLHHYYFFVEYLGDRIFVEKSSSNGIKYQEEEEAIVMKDFNAISLEEFITHCRLSTNSKQIISTVDFLRIALHLAVGLNNIHKRGIIFKTICTKHIIIQPDKLKQMPLDGDLSSLFVNDFVKYIDFGWSSFIPKETPLADFHHWDSPGDTLTNSSFLPFISPEQTGKFNHDVDFRSDFYSLGVVLYYLLVGKLPLCPWRYSKAAADDIEEGEYSTRSSTATLSGSSSSGDLSQPEISWDDDFSSSENVLDWYYCHIALNPKSPSQLTLGEVPLNISGVILKLLAKDPEERYQSSYGLIQDLFKCLDIALGNCTSESFIVGEHDIRSHFQLVQKLYGREREISKLLSWYESVACGKLKTLFITVSGYSGSGKTMLIQEIYKPLSRKKGFLLRGKVDQYNRDIPYGGIVQAIQQLFSQLLMERYEEIAGWKNKLSVTLNRYLKVVQSLIGTDFFSTPSVSEEEMIDINQMNVKDKEQTIIYALQLFFQVFASRKHPLVMFLDDLQWADIGTLKLIESLIGSPNIEYLIIIGAYRDNEISDDHHLLKMSYRLKKIEKTKHIQLSTLNSEHITQFICDSFRIPKYKQSSIIPLSETIKFKTDGNPFYVISYLTSLNKAGLIRFNFEEGKWIWNVDTIIQKTSATNNVVDFLIKQIQQFSKEEQQVLAVASILGNSFDLDLLTIVCEKTNLEIIKLLSPAVIDGLLLQYGEDLKYLLRKEAIESKNIRVSYRFLHDKVQQACYALLPVNSIEDLHLRICKILVHIYSHQDSHKNETLFSIMSHAEQCKGKLVLESDNLRLQCAQICLAATSKAKLNFAYIQSISFANMGLLLIPCSKEEVWKKYYQITYDLHKELLEATMLNQNFEDCDNLIESLLPHCSHSLFDTVRILEIRGLIYEQQLKYVECVELVTALLQKILPNSSFPTNNEHLCLQMLPEKFQRVDKIVSGRQISEVIESCPQMTNPQDLLIMKLFYLGYLVTYITGKIGLLSVLVADICHFTLSKGISVYSSLALVYYGYIKLHHNCDVKSAVEYANVGISLAEKCSEFALGRCDVIYNAFICPLFATPHEALKRVEKLYNISEKCGDIATRDISLAEKFCVLSTLESNLSVQISELGDDIAKVKNANTLVYLMSAYYFKYICYLADDHSFDDIEFDEVRKHDAFRANTAIAMGQKFRIAYSSRENRTKLVELAIISCYLSRNYLFGICLTIDVFTKGACVLFSHLKKMGSTLDIVPEGFKKLQFGLTLSEIEEKVGDIMNDEIAILDMALEILSILQRYAEACPKMYKSKYLLCKGSYELFKSNTWGAICYWREAIQNAQSSNLNVTEATIHEMLADLWNSEGESSYATLHMQRAGLIWKQCGAVKKSMQHSNFEVFETIKENLSSPNSCNVSTDSDTLITNSIPQEPNQRHSPVTPQVDLITLALNEDMDLEKLLDISMRLFLKVSGADYGMYILNQDGEMLVLSIAGTHDVIPDHINKHQENVLYYMKLEDAIKTMQIKCPLKAIQYACHSKKTVIIEDVSKNEDFQNDPYIQNGPAKTLMIMPVIQNYEVRSILYLENAAIAGIFDKRSEKSIRTLASQIYQLLESKFHGLLYQEKKHRAIAAQLELNRKRLEDFIDVLCHELRNPLNGVLGSHTLLRESAKVLSEKLSTMKIVNTSDIGIKKVLKEIDEMIHNIGVSCEHLLHIVDTVLTVSMLEKKKEEIHNVLFDVRDVIKTVISIFQAKFIEKKITLDLSAPNNQCTIFLGDKYRIIQILINILSNAIKFTNYGGRVKISFSVQNQQEISNVLARMIQFEIEDTGIGISEKDKQNLFVSWGQANESIYKDFGGSGLGLKISEQLATLLGGWINCESEGPSKGCKFICAVQCSEATEEQKEHFRKEGSKSSLTTAYTISCLESMAGHLEPTSSESSPSSLHSSTSSTTATTTNTPIDLPIAQSSISPQRSLTPTPKSRITRNRILIAEDNTINQRILAKILSKENLEIDIVEDGSEAVSAICFDEEHHSRYLMAFFDILMPVLSGMDACKKIREFEQSHNVSRRLPIVAVSANSRQEQITKAIQQGFDHYITKPFQRKDIIQALNNFRPSQ